MKKAYLFLVACLALGSCSENFNGGLWFVPLLPFLGSVVFFIQMTDKKNRGVNFKVGCLLLALSALLYLAIRGNWFN